MGFLGMHQSSGPLKSNFDEMKLVDTTKFKNFYLDRSQDGLVELSMQMARYQALDIVTGPFFVNATFHPASISAVLNELTADKASFVLFTWDTEIGLDETKVLTEEIYGARYTVNRK